MQTIEQRITRQFLVSIDTDHLLHEIAPDGTAIGSRYPSAAWHFDSYQAADAACQRLYKLGYTKSVVTDALGRPIRITDLQQILKSQDSYSIRIDESRFVRSVDGQEVEVTTDINSATLMTYEVASQLLRKLRRRFRYATVCNASGSPVNQN